MDHIKTDVAVLGAGGAGVFAAVTAAEGGAKVIVLEKRPFPGGNTNYAMMALGLKKERDWAFKEFMEFSRWRANARLVRVYLDKAATLREYLESHGVKLGEVPPMGKSNPNVAMILLKAKGRGHGGASMIKTMVKKGKELGVDFCFSTPAKKILKEGQRVTGIIAENKFGETLQVDAEAVIIASGGYGDSQGMIKEHTGFNHGEDMFTMKDLKLTGDGIRMAWEAGAAKGATGVHILYNVPGPGIADEVPWMAKNQVRIIQSQPYLWVNQQGQRFFDEGVAINPTFTGNAIAKQKNRCAYLIFDGLSRKYMEEEGFEYPYELVFPGNKRLRDFDEQIKGLKDIGNKNVFIADSLKALANSMGIDPDELQKNVDEYNRFCENGHDDLFAKDPKFLHPVKKPAFYAFRVIPSAYGTIGGIKVNEMMEVLNKESNVIPGLYAAGSDANMLYGDTPDYNWKLTGSALGFALNSGRIAGEFVVEYINSRGRNSDYK
jgi:fumarate reductase flavoprotein subunit